MPELFRTSLEDLTLLDLRAFLAGAEAEPLLWEAKGTQVTAHEIRRQCGGFANSERGGFLILGASFEGSTWDCGGVEFPDGEPHRYITSCLTEGLRPIPSYDVKAFPVDGDRHIAVVEVQPLEAGPAIVRGTVYERVPGATIPVRDPSRLAALYARGQRAHTAARAAAERMLRVAGEQLGTLQEHPAEVNEPSASQLFAVLAVGPVAPGPNVSVRLFTEAARQLLVDTVTALADTPPPFHPTIQLVVAQDRRVAFARAQQPFESDWSVMALWDGAVGVFVRMLGRGSVDQLAREPLERAWSGAVATATGLGLTGDVYLALVITHEVWWPEGTRIDRGPFLLSDGPDWASIGRELSRAAGVDAAEPG